MILRVENISYSYRYDDAIKNISFEQNKHETIAILGESGSGKTTLLKIIAGFIKPHTGQITLEDKILCNQKTFIKPEKRNIGLVFQDIALFPHLSVKKNIAFGMSQKNLPDIEYYLKLIGMEEYINRYPHQLSGGQQQRVALARALAAKPGLLLLDEPFSSLDNTLKIQMRKEVKQILQQTQIPAIIVTHDMNDCTDLADKILVLKSGHVLQFDYIRNIYNHPADEYTARLFGKINMLTSDFINKYFKLNLNAMNNYIVRPEHIEITSQNEGLKAQITEVIFKGKYYEITCHVDNFELTVYSKDEKEFNNFIGIKIQPDKIISVCK
jgi:iron(III) transport system ATP-binding protein